MPKKRGPHVKSRKYKKSLLYDETSPLLVRALETGNS